MVTRSEHFSGCYVLEELVVMKCVLQRQCKFSVCSPTLKRLAIASIGGLHNDYEIVIDAPSLVYFSRGGDDQVDGKVDDRNGGKAELKRTFG
ncbi:hypothetical protein PTKIN_Ptkin14bG0056100 [Pterospermum kingtungense]